MPKSALSNLSTVPEMESLSDNDASSTKSESDSESKQEYQEDLTLSSLQSLGDLLVNPHNFLHTILLPPSKGEQSDDFDGKALYFEQIDLLRSVSKTLFSRIEKLGYFLEKIEDRQKRDVDKDDADLQEEKDEDDSPLSGLSELFTGEDGEPSDRTEPSHMAFDAETIWGQVDIQNAALLAKVTKSIRKLSKIADKSDKNDNEHIRLLDMENINSDVDSDEGDDSSDDIGSGDSEADGSDDEDELSKRIRERMERTMADMDNTDEEDSEIDDGSEEDNQNDDDSEGLIDPMRDELNDGFFDLHEMEAFADEEEDMLPEEAFGQPEQPDAAAAAALEERKSKLPHLRGRVGKDGDFDDDDYDDVHKRVESSSRRKKYRDQDDINALEALYQDGDDDDDDDDDVINMTAADFFGPPKNPNTKFLKKQEKSVKDKNKSIDNGSDEDSWDNHDFDDNGADWRDAKDDESANSSSENDDGDGEDEDDDGSASNDSTTENNTQVESQTTAKLSKYAEQNKKLNALTEALEKEAITEKPWMMLGEASSMKRPENSLLDVTPEFEFATKMAPIITQEHTESIEEMIKRRVLAEDWDDVVPRELPDIGLDKRKGELPEVSQEKSKLSLGELYEREYLKKATGYDKDAEEKETEEEKAKNEMKMLFANICSKLDALSNYHFAPRPVADEAVVKTASTPAIAMEEVIPLHVSDAQAMAPEEIYAKKKGRDGILRSESELNQVSFKIKIPLLFPEHLRVTLTANVRIIRTIGKS
jgi:U3 small nucleolar RNA-associated protein MPP10